MRVGHGAQRLEVVAGERMGGYADRSQGVRSVLEPLEVHVVTFADEAHRFALVVADLICVNTDIVELIRAAFLELRIDSCWVAATHTHASPEAGCVPGGSPTPPALGERIVDAAVAAAKAAVVDERATSLGYTRAWVAGLAGRRNAGDATPIDVPVDAIVVSNEETVVGVVTVSPVHPTVLPADNSDVSADLNGGIRRVLDAPGRWVVAATGAAGNISTRHTRQGRSLNEIDRLAAVAANSLELDAARRSQPADGTIHPPASRVIRLEPKLPAEVEAAMAAVPPAAIQADARSHEVFEQGRRIARELATQRRVEAYDVEIQAVSLAGITLVAIPGELFLELGESIRGAAGSDVIVLGYANGYLGYLPSLSTPPTYETLVSPVRLGSGEQVVDAAVHIAESVRGGEERT
ncbi:hypothetical protein ABN028_33395 [Actinopolymorpha sp. B17G11]|uniref:hypothetical protein n=1 Tax=Actinopolymorpha sp. B17G11 TaxID=3160861 RepID=UPI0032E411A3